MRYRNRAHTLKAARTATQALELAMTAPQVMSIRLMNMALAGASPSARDHREFHRMGAEKLVTFYESWNAMWLELFRANLKLAFTPFQFWGSSARQQRASLGILAAGLAPIHRRVTGNARRLRRRSFR